MDKQKEVYMEEAYELLAELEVSLLELEETPDDAELIGRVFRALHTIKGSGDMAGFNDIADFTHEIETVFDFVRDGKIAVTKELVNLALSARDQIRTMLDESEGGEAADDFRSRGIIMALRELLSDVSEDTAILKEVQVPTPSENVMFNDLEGNVTYRIRFRPKRGVFKNGTNPIFLLNELRELGVCSILAQTDAVPKLNEIDPESCYTYWDIILTTSRGINAIKDVFIFVEGDCEMNIEMIDDDGWLETIDSDYKRLGQILLERHDLACDDLMRALLEQKRIGDKLVEDNLVDRGIVESALAEQQHIKQVRKKRHEIAMASTIRVPAEKLDRLVDLVGELVTLQARFSQEVSGYEEDGEQDNAELDNAGMDNVEQDNTELVSIAEELERLTEDLRDTTMSIRMLPISTTFSTFKRLVRDLSDDLGKEVVMETEGGDTELDKTVIERLSDPLMHIIRNSIDHGIETPKVRESSGKPRHGAIRLSAEHSGADVLIRISDDGAGLDPEAIHSKAKERGIISPDAELSENEIFSQIFAPGFSTSEEVTDISGRGVGMDVVKRSVDELRGSVEVSSKKGVGSTFTLKLPLTLAIIDGFLVKIGEGHFVLPLSVVEECVNLEPEEMIKARKRNLINLRGEIVQYIDLRELFVIQEGSSHNERVVIVEAKSDRIGLGVDRVIGQHQTVIKTLGKAYKNVEGISGATILGDGTVALILDVNQMIQLVENGV
ncbi:chemotaxis protein CheA [Desulfobacterales bacterium HSG2]|nr:chemotaxis protein CheA [Desulfobacterales bacterium HSG2]